MTIRTRAQIIERAMLHVGHRETSNNRSPLIDAWLRRCGLGPGYAWCAAFASWCVEERLDRKLGVPVAVAEAGAINLGRTFPATQTPEPGDLMWFATNDTGSGHVGIVTWVGHTEVVCIEGNSANQVRYVRRLRSEVQFSRTRNEAEPTGAVLPAADVPLIRVSRAGTR